ncbi:DUF4097 family beta strand repeat-containing protein [Peribacillus simplex]|uniref:DUF4097 family beta strand repeat-containing protein n=1 Tax=Peribacillus simplex TaxID=1478 RepID=UPI003D2819FB
MKKYMGVLILLGLIILVACTNGEEAEDFQKTSLSNIDTIHIENASTKVNVVSADIEDLEVSLLLYDDGPGIIMDKGKRKITIGLKNDITRLAKLGKKPELEVRIPSEFEGEIIVDGSSGNVVGKELKTHNLQVDVSSGNVKLDFLNFHSNVYVTTTSGNVDVSVNENEPDTTLSLKSNSGRRSVGIVLDEQQQRKKETKGTSGSGDYEVKLETASGNISLK